VEERTVGTSGHTEALPKTASQLPLVGLIGLLSLSAALALRAKRA
jgi:LPXTG-motif cell wall-anchored protein